MRIKVTYSDGTTEELSSADTIFIRNYPISETPKPGYEKTREYPPEWSRFTPLRASVLVKGAYVSTGGKVVRVEAVEHLDKNIKEKDEQHY